MTNAKVTRLQVYLEYAKNRVKTETSDKKEFFEREVRKTQAELDRLTK